MESEEGYGQQKNVSALILYDSEGISWRLYELQHHNGFHNVS